MRILKINELTSLNIGQNEATLLISTYKGDKLEHQDVFFYTPLGAQSMRNQHIARWEGNPDLVKVSDYEYADKSGRFSCKIELL